MAFLLGVPWFSRMASDSEIVAPRASGVFSPARLLRPVTARLLACAITSTVAMPCPRPTGLPRADLQPGGEQGEDRHRASGLNDELPPAEIWSSTSQTSAESGEWRDVFIHDGRRPQQPAVIRPAAGT
jgi:hypothetical protein